MARTSKADEDFKLCADWLKRTGVLAPESPIFRPNAQLYDLVFALRDGVTLCCLLNVLQPGCMDTRKFSLHPQSSLFLCKRNVRTFLDTCQSVFGLQEKDLFLPTDLWQPTEFSCIIPTLSKLSQSPLAVASGIQPFKISAKTADYMNLEAPAAHRVDDYDGIYCNSSVLLGQDQRKNDDIYGELVDYMKFQVKPTSKDAKKKTQADLCVVELIDTEKAYVDALKMITEGFMKPLTTLLPATEHKTLFCNINKLYDIHSRFLSELTAAGAPENTDVVSDKFITFKEAFLSYGDYCANLPAAQKLLETLQASPNQWAHEQIRTCEKKVHDSKYRLYDVLVLPVQRVLKYHLFLKELTKHYPGKQRWLIALREIEDLSLFINEVKRDNEILNNISQIESSIPNLPLENGASLKDYGRLHIDGELKMKGRRGKTNHLFLFDKLLLICSTRNDTNEYEMYLETKLYDLDVKVVPDKTMNSYHLFGLRSRGPLAETHVFGSKDKDVVRKWIQAIKMAQDNVSPEYAHVGEHDFVMASFNTATICDVCRKLLRGSFFQGYKCQKTNMTAHKECLEKAGAVEMPKIIPRRESAAPLDRGSWKPELSGNINGRPQPVYDSAARRGASNYEECFMDDAPATAVSDARNQGTPSRPRISDNGTRTELAEGPAPPQGCKRTPMLRQSQTFDFPSSDYVNEFGTPPWDAGKMTRPDAENLLISKPPGTFLVRGSMARAGELALSLRVGDTVKHIIIQRTPDNLLFFKPNHKFATVDDLVQHYQNNILTEIAILLGRPFREYERRRGTVPSLGKVPVTAPVTSDVICYCTALYSYAATAASQLSFQAGDKIAVINKAAESNGWWKGRLNSQVGFFPYNYVEEDL